MATPRASLPSLRAFLGAIALSKTTTTSPNLGLFSLLGGLTKNDCDVRDVVNAAIAALDSGGGGATGAAGGALAGTYPNPTIAGVARNAIDANTLHAYLCNDASGTLTDTGYTAGARVAAALNGTVLTDYFQGASRPAKLTKGLRLPAPSGSAPGGAQATVTGMGSGAYSIEALALVEEYESAAGNVATFVAIDDGTANNGLSLGLVNSGNIFASCKVASSDANTSSAGNPAPFAMPLMVPVHVMAVYDQAAGVQLKVYRNGVLAAGLVAANGTLPSLTRITIGNRGALDAGMRGWIGEVRISNVARSQAYAIAAAEAALSL